MGRRGPKPTPTPLLKLRGSWRAETREDEPEVVTELPEMPEWLSGRAAEYWSEVGAMLHGLGIMARPHTIALALLADALADWVKWSKAAEEPPVQPGIYDLKAKAWDRVLKACREFGMTPSAITSVKSIKSEAKGKRKFPRLSVG